MFKKVLIYITILFVNTICYGQDTIHLSEYYDGLKTTEVIISGKKFVFLFDTGGGKTFLSPTIIKELGIKEYGCEEGLRMNGEKITYTNADSIVIRLGKVDVFHQRVGVWDVMSVLPKEFSKLDGIISLQSFNDKRLTLDLSKDLLIVESKKSLRNRTKGMTMLPSRFANGHNGTELNLITGVNIMGQVIWFLFDSGNIGEVLLSKNCNANINIGETVSIVTIGIGSNEETFAVSKKDIIYEGVLNYKVISKYIFVIDFCKHKVWSS